MTYWRKPLLILIVLLLSGCGEQVDQAVDQDGTAPPPNPSESVPSRTELVANTSSTTPPNEPLPTIDPDTLDPDGDGFMSEDELKVAIDSRAKEFLFPSGYSLSTTSMFEQVTEPHPDVAKYSAGSEYTLLGDAHLCAWGAEYIRAFQQNNQSMMDVSMDQLTSVTLNVPTFQSIAPNLKDMFDEASLGDISQLQLYLELECNWTFFDSTPEPGTAGPPATNIQHHSIHLTPVSRYARLPNTLMELTRETSSHYAYTLPVRHTRFTNIRSKKKEFSWS